MNSCQRIGGAGLLCLAFLAGCGESPQPAEGDGEPELPETPAEFAAGQTIYDANCASCHDSSRDGAPRLGFLTAWSRRLEQGEETLVRHAIEGLDMMPPKGDNPDLTDEQISSAVGYMVYRSKLNIPASH